MQQNIEHWKEFYKNKDRQEPSDFACFCFCQIPKGSIILEIGAGDGRDTQLLAKRGNVLAIEPNNKIGRYYQGTFEDFEQNELSYQPDVIYARWLLHSVTEETEAKILDYAQRKGATLMLEFRAKGDIVPNDGHDRRLIDPYDLLENLVVERGYKILSFDVDYGYSKQGDSDPYLCRIIAEHKGC